MHSQKKQINNKEEEEMEGRIGKSNTDIVNSGSGPAYQIYVLLERGP
jgi:hypothetical protein